MTRPTRPTQIMDKTLSRRSVVQWLGKATVVSLSSELLLACGRAEPQARPDSGGRDGAPPTADATAPDGMPLGADAAAQPDSGLFYPGAGTQPIFDDWPVRTVDPQDLASILKSWRLRVTGMVQEELELTFAELLALPRQRQVTDFHCVEGWSVYDVPWDGVRLSELLARARPAASASYVTFYTVGRQYNESLPLAVAREDKTLLGFGVNGATLPLKHGFPLRLVVPRLLAYKNAKYVETLELTDAPVEGYWVRVGYPYDGEVPEERLRPGKY